MFSWVFEDGVEERPGWDRPGDPSVERRTTRFRSWRGGGRWHAACDLVVPTGTPVRAICDGTVLEFSSFYEGTWELVVEHEHEGYAPFIARYGEVASPESGGPQRVRGERVTGGDVIAHVGQLGSGGHMLHFELYAGTGRTPSLSMPRNRGSSTGPDEYTEEQLAALSTSHWHPYFQRRNDLCDPAPFLLALKQGAAPPAPTPFESGGHAAGTEFLSFEDHLVVGRRTSHATSARSPGPCGTSTERARYNHLPSWRETHTGLCEEEHLDATPSLRSRARGPME